MGLSIIVLLVVLGLATIPQFWVKRVLDRHSVEREDFPGSGGELARHLLNELQLHAVGVEETSQGDHYDPETKTVRLLRQHMRGRSLTALVVAAHEVGHAIQDATGYRPLAARTRMARQARTIERIGAILMLTAPLLLVVFKAPVLVVLQMVAGLLVLASSILMHVFTLPVEFDASFARALPILKGGRYIGDKDMPAARQILKAAAFTYVAAAAMSLFDVMRWLRMLRF